MSERVKNGYFPPFNKCSHAYVDLGEYGYKPASPELIPSALERMSNPSARMVDRLFWFHTNPSAIDGLCSQEEPLRRHDEFLFRLIYAYAKADTQNLAPVVRALREWKLHLEWVRDESDLMNYEVLLIAGGRSSLAARLKAAVSAAFPLAVAPLELAANGAIDKGDVPCFRSLARALRKVQEIDPCGKEVLSRLANKLTEEVRSIFSYFIEKEAERPRAGDLTPRDHFNAAEDMLAYCETNICPQLRMLESLFPADKSRTMPFRTEYDQFFEQMLRSVQEAGDGDLSDRVSKALEHERPLDYPLMKLSWNLLERERQKAKRIWGTGTRS